VKPKKAKLGTLRSKKELIPFPPTPEETIPEPSIPPSKDEHKAKKKLGTLGGRDKTPKKDATLFHEAEQVRGRSLVVEKEGTPPPRETSKERADKKRLQLKRELEDKAKAPVKKKRKF